MKILLGIFLLIAIAVHANGQSGAALIVGELVKESSLSVNAIQRGATWKNLWLASFPRNAEAEKIRERSRNRAATEQHLDEMLQLAETNSSLRVEAMKTSGISDSREFDAKVQRLRALVKVLGKQEAKTAGQNPDIKVFGTNQIGIWDPSGSKGSLTQAVQSPAAAPASIPVSIPSLRANGSDGSLIVYLKNKMLIDSTCTSLVKRECRLSIVELTQPKVTARTRVNLVLENPDDFIETYDSIVREESARSTETPEGHAGTRQNEERMFCETEYKVCVSSGSASLVIGCEGLGELEISTKGKLSVSLSLPKGSPSVDARE